MIELHFHALPGVDDGPATLEESLALIRAATLEGTRTIVATPHLRGDFLTSVEPIADGVAELRAALRGENLDVSLVAGAELGHDMVARLDQRALERIALGPADARWLLVETPFAAEPDELEDALDELGERGFGIVLAHPERAPARLVPTVERAIERGAAAQVNATSFLGRHGEEARRAALRMLLDRRVAAVASDAHGWARMPVLGLWLATAPRRGVAPGLARRLVEGGPAGLLGRGVAARPAAAAA